MCMPNLSCTAKISTLRLRSEIARSLRRPALANCHCKFILANARTNQMISFVQTTSKGSYGFFFKIEVVIGW